MDDFYLRISVADVTSDGNFSRFDGVQRTLGILSGNGLVLTQDGQPLATLSSNSPLLDFCGSSPIHARLQDGPVRDFNVMSRSDSCQHQTMRLSLHGRSGLPASLPCLVFVASGDAVSVSDGHHYEMLGCHDAAWLAQPQSLSLHSATPCELIIVTMRQRYR